MCSHRPSHNMARAIISWPLIGWAEQIGLYVSRSSDGSRIRFVTMVSEIIKSPPTMWWWRLIVFAESARRRRHLFLLSLKNPYSDYFQIFTVCILALGNLPGEFFFSFFSFFNKIKDGRQNPMAHARAQTASSICFMFGLKERLYPGRELESF